MGRTEIARVADALHALRPQQLFLVTGRDAYRTSGAEAALAPILPRAVVHFRDFEINPKLDDVRRGMALYRDSGCTAILAVGGGTAIDVAKLVGVLSAQPSDDPVGLATGQRAIVAPMPPLVAVPTTAGTGSEATHFAVVYVDGSKYSVAHSSMRPTYAIVDPELTDGLPPAITATTGLDAFCQAVESLWCVNATPETQQWSARAIRLVLAHLPAAVNAPTVVDRDAMSEAAHLAGKAIDVTKTTAPHALSYTLTSEFGVPHGHAVAMTLGAVLAFNGAVTDADVTDPRGAAYVRETMRHLYDLLGCADAASARRRVTALVASIGLATRLRDVGVHTAQQRRRLAANVNPQRLANNPRALTAADLAALVDSVA